MAISATTIWEVRTTGSDSNCSGGFDPGQSANMLTDGAATSATGNSPVFSSASYNFVAGDVGAKVYIHSGTNWTPGWYEIASVATNQATLKAAVGEAVDKTTERPNTVAGCATTASPTGATWSIDYSQQAAAKYTYTDITYVSGTTFTSAANPFGKEQVGNIIKITGGTNFTAGFYCITSVTTVTATLDRTACSGASSNGAGSQGGAFASPGYAEAQCVASNKVWYRAGTYTMTSTSSNVTVGRVVISNSGSATAPNKRHGYSTVRGDGTTYHAVFAAGVGFTATFIFHINTNFCDVAFIKVDGDSRSTVKGMYCNQQVNRIYRCAAFNCPDRGFLPQASSVELVSCYAENNSNNYDATAGAELNWCVGKNATSNCFAGATSAIFRNCVSWDSAADAFDNNQTTGVRFINCTAYSAVGNGFDLQGRDATAINCLAVDSGGYGFAAGSSRPLINLLNCAGHNNTSGNIQSANLPGSVGFITLTGGPFTNAAAGDFSLNNTSGAGAALRAAGYNTFLGISTTGYLDVGAVQHQDSGGGSAGILPVSNMTGNMI